EVGCDSSGSGDFVGKRTDRDVLFISNFTNGGTLSNVQAFYWLDPDYWQCIDGGGDAVSCAPLQENGDECLGDPGPNDISECSEELPADDLIEMPFITANTCASQTPSPGSLTVDLCASTNTSNIMPAWPTESNVGGVGVLAENMYFEVAINFTGLLPNASEICLGSFMFETRASQSITANLFDYALGSLNTCSELIIIKETDPTPDSTLFEFSATEGAGTGGVALPGSPDSTSDDGSALEFGDLIPGAYNAAEPSSLAGWDLDDITCRDASNAVVASDANPTAGGDDIDVTLGIGDSVTCTFHNTKRGTIVIEKETVGGFGAFTFTPGGFTMDG
ncbi:hypothetical protein LCGC14_3160410, partial [marine sediment metagenome]